MTRLLLKQQPQPLRLVLHSGPKFKHLDYLKFWTTLVTLFSKYRDIGEAKITNVSEHVTKNLN